MYSYRYNPKVTRFIAILGLMLIFFSFLCLCSTVMSQLILDCLIWIILYTVSMVGHDNRSIYKYISPLPQRWEKAVTPSVQIFHSCDNFWFLHAFFSRLLHIFFVFFALFFLSAFLNSAFCTFLCTIFSDSKLNQCYLVSFFHLCTTTTTTTQFSSVQFSRQLELTKPFILQSRAALREITQCEIFVHHITTMFF